MKQKWHTSVSLGSVTEMVMCITMFAPTCRNAVDGCLGKRLWLSRTSLPTSARFSLKGWPGSGSFNTSACYDTALFPLLTSHWLPWIQNLFCSIAMASILRCWTQFRESSMLRRWIYLYKINSCSGPKLADMVPRGFSILARIVIADFCLYLLFLPWSAASAWFSVFLSKQGHSPMAIGGFFGPDGVGSVTAPATFCPCQGHWESGFDCLFIQAPSLFAWEGRGPGCSAASCFFAWNLCRASNVLWMSLPHAKVSNMQHLCFWKKFPSLFVNTFYNPSPWNQLSRSHILVQYDIPYPFATNLEDVCFGLF